MMKHRKLMVGRRGEAPLVPPYKLSSLKLARVVVRQLAPLSVGGVTDTMLPVDCADRNAMPVRQLADHFFRVVD